VIISFIWGAVIFAEPVKNLWLALLGLALIILGILGVALSKTENPRTTTQTQPEPNSIPDEMNVTHITLPENPPQNNSLAEIGLADERSPLKNDPTQRINVDVPNDSHMETHDTSPETKVNENTENKEILNENENDEIRINESPIKPENGDISGINFVEEVEEHPPRLDITPNFDIDTTIQIGRKSIGPEIVHQDSYYPVSDFTQQEVTHHGVDLLNQTIIQPGLSKLEILKVYFHRGKKYILGFPCAFMVALLAGSMYAPNRFSPVQGIVFLFSFGCGVGIVTIVMFPIYFLLKRQWPKMHWKVAPLHGLASGLFWSIGNFCTTYVVLSPLGFTVGYPLVQLSFVIAGICGIVIFREIRNWKVLVQFFAATFLLLVPGAILLGFFGKA
jgi:hypothetical protein